jgi:hypothetical protein
VGILLETFRGGTADDIQKSTSQVQINPTQVQIIQLKCQLAVI